MKRKPSSGGAKHMEQSYKTVGFSCLVGVLITTALLFLAALVISSIDFPQSAIAPVAIAAAVAGCFGAGFICARKTKSNGMLYGFVCGMVIFFLCLLCEVSFMGGEIGMLALYKLIICVTSAMIGGILGVNKRRKAR